MKVLKEKMAIYFKSFVWSEEVLLKQNAKLGSYKNSDKFTNIKIENCYEEK